MSKISVKKSTLKKQRETIGTFNTVIQTAVLGLLNKNSNPISLITDFIILGSGNYVLAKTADTFSSKMNKEMQESYLPVTSALFASMYGNLMYDYSFPRLIAFNGLIAGTQIYTLDKLS